MGLIFGLMLFALTMTGASLPAAVTIIAFTIGGLDAAASRGMIPDVRGPF